MLVQTVRKSPPNPERDEVEADAGSVWRSFGELDIPPFRSPKPSIAVQRWSPKNQIYTFVLRRVHKCFERSYLGRSPTL